MEMYIFGQMVELLDLIHHPLISPIWRHIILRERQRAESGRMQLLDGDASR